jgi:hypothetical protein
MKDINTINIFLNNNQIDLDLRVKTRNYLHYFYEEGVDEQQ